jgi:hypothetical protein
MIYLESLQVIGAAILRDAHKKVLHRDKLGDHVLFAYNETKRMLAVLAKLQVRIPVGRYG